MPFRTEPIEFAEIRVLYQNVLSREISVENKTEN